MRRDTTTITIQKKTYKRLLKFKLKEQHLLGRLLTWDEFFDDCCKKIKC